MTESSGHQDNGTHYCGSACDPPHRLDVWSEEATEAKVRERIAEQVMTLAPDESGRISKGLALAYILGELDAVIAREDTPA